MKVLLCTPFTSDSQFVQGGIAIWARNIIDYHRTLNDGIQIDVLAFDRKVKLHSNISNSFWSRVWGGIIDYRKPVLQTLKEIKSGKYDVIHLCTSASISLIKDIVILKVAKRFGVKSVIHFHFGRIPELAQKKSWEWNVLEKVVQIADVTITMDEKSYKTLTQAGFKYVRYLPNPLSQGIIRQIDEEEKSIIRKEDLICFVGHVIPTKGVYELVKACRGINGIKLSIVGKVSDEVREKMTQLSGNGEWMTFKGEIDHPDVIKELLASYIFALPTYTEGFPNVILESMACGCAIVTTPVGAIPEMLDLYSDTPCGLCSEVKDVEGLRNNITFFLNNLNEARAYASRATKRVKEMYSVSLVWRQLVRIWEQ